MENKILARYRRGESPLCIAMDLRVPLEDVLTALKMHINTNGYIVPDGVRVRRTRVLGVKR